jgi:DNA ligase (NAD+)
VIEECERWSKVRDEFPYELDGVVIKVDDFELQNICGFTSHHPAMGLLLLNSRPKQATTKLLDIEYQIGKIGSITPVAKVEPVFISGCDDLLYLASQ